MTISIAVPADGPFFDGHFPGRPILPGIAELVLVARALAPSGDAAHVSALPFVRFRGLVLPADALELSAEPRSQGGVRFDVRRAGAVVANGAMTFGAPAPDDRSASAVAARSVKESMAVRELIPHRPPMLFVDEVLGEAEDGASALGRVPRACALVERGRAPAFVALELAAQTAAAWEALRRSRAAGSPEPRMGYLVSVKDVVLHTSTIPADADLIATVRLVGVAPPLATYSVEIDVSGACALRGTIGTYLSE